MGAKRKDTGGRHRLAMAVLAVAVLLALSVFLPVAEWAEQLERCGLMNDGWLGSFHGLSASTRAPSACASASRLRIRLR